MNKIIQERIILSSSQLLLSKGMKHITVMELAKASNVSLRTFYSYFESKESVVGYIISEGLKTNLKTLNKVRKEIKNPMDAYAVFTSHTYNGVKVMSEEFFTDLVKYFPKQYSLMQSFLLNDVVNFYIYMMKEGKKLGLIRNNVNNKICSIYFAETAINTMYEIFLNRKEFPKEQVYIELHKIMIYGICTKKGIDRFNKAAEHYFPELIYT